MHGAEIHCGAITIVSQIIIAKYCYTLPFHRRSLDAICYNGHYLAHPWCLSWVWTIVYGLAPSLQYYMKYPAVLDRVIRALNRIGYLNCLTISRWRYQILQLKLLNKRLLKAIKRTHGEIKWHDKIFNIVKDVQMFEKRKINHIANHSTSRLCLNLNKASMKITDVVMLLFTLSVAGSCKCNCKCKCNFRGLVVQKWIVMFVKIQRRSFRWHSADPKFAIPDFH